MGTIIELPDGRRGTVVYNGLDGVGIKFGEINLTKNDKELISKGVGGLWKLGVREPMPPDFDLFAEALLREPYEGAGIECVGEEFEIIKEME